MTKLRSGVTKEIWRALPSGPNSGSIWAPELHLIGTKWYLYYTGSDRTTMTTFIAIRS
jgi:GH43 family beta-xylosidase